MDYEKLKEVIAKQIKENGKREITGPVLQAVLMAMVDSLGEVYPQTYTDEEKAQARANIDALSNHNGEITKEKLSLEVQAILNDVSNKQNISDATLATIAKTIVGAINEVYKGGLEDASIATSKIKDGAITDAKIANGAVTTEKVNDGAITEPKLDTDLVNIITSAVQPAGLASAITTALASYVAKADIVDTTGSATDKVMSQHGVTEAIDGVTNKVTKLDGMVTQLDESFVHITEWAENRLNPATCASGLINSAGTIFTGGSYDSYTYTDYIRVKPGVTYSLQYGNETLTAGREKFYINRYCFFDENKTLMSGSDTAAMEVTIPSGVSFIRFCFYNTLANVTAQYYAFVEGTALKDFVPYAEDSHSLVLKAEANNTPYIEGIVEEKMAGTKFGPENTDTSLGANIFDKDALVQGTNYWLNTFSWNGSDSANSSYFTAMLPVKPNQQYLFWQGEKMVGVRAVNEYDADGNFISGTSVGNAYIVKTGSNTAFIKCSFVTGSESAITVEPIVQNGATVHAFIPSSLYCAVGRTIELYNSQVCLAKYINVQWRINNRTANSIRPLKRKLQILGNETGKAVAVFVAYDDNKNILFAGETRLYFVSASLSSIKSIVPVGDSLTNDKAWLAEVERLSGNNINYVGEYSWGLQDADGNMQTGGHEGRSGFSAKDYATGAIYTYGGESNPNKWWNGNRFSLTAFENATSINPDIVQLWVGVNGLSDNNAENANYIKTLVDNIRLDNASIPIFVCVTPFKGDQNAIGLQGSVDGFVAGVSTWKYNEDFKIMDLMKRIYTIFSSGYTNVHIIDLAISMDSEYNYGWQDVPVNPRAVQTEHIQTDSVHPQAQGYFQIADILFSNYCAVLNV